MRAYSMDLRQRIDGTLVAGIATRTPSDSVVPSPSIVENSNASGYVS